MTQTEQPAYLLKGKGQICEGDAERYPAMTLRNHERVGVLTFYGDGSVPVQAEWKGGDVIGISREMLLHASRKYLRRSGDIIQIMQYTVRIIGVHTTNEGEPYMYICQRVRESGGAE